MESGTKNKENKNKLKRIQVNNWKLYLADVYISIEDSAYIFNMTIFGSLLSIVII